MRCRLGALPVRSLEFESLLLRLGSFLERIRQGAGSGSGRKDPDLLDILPPIPSDREWVQPLADTLTCLQTTGRQELQLVECWYEEPGKGALAIAVYDAQIGADIVVGDSVQAGFAAIRAREGQLSIAPRIYRKTCANGTVMALRDGKCKFKEERDVAAAIEACLEPKTFSGHVATLRHAARVSVSDPIHALRVAGVTSPLRPVARAFDRGGDPSVWGLINAATAEARTEPNWERRLDREADAARILARMPELNREIGPGLLDLARRELEGQPHRDPIESSELGSLR